MNDRVENCPFGLPAPIQQWLTNRTTPRITVMMKSLSVLTSDEYLVITKDFLLKDDQYLSFDIYGSSNSFSREKPILLASKDSAIANLETAIANIQYGQLYIKKHDEEKFNLFLENTLQSALDHTETTVEKKAVLLYTCAKNAVTDVFNNPRSGKNVARVQNIAEGLIKLILNNASSASILAKLCTHDFYTFTHSVNVCVFGISFWQMLGFGRNERELQDFAIGCLLHDIGKSQISKNILKKPGRLSKEETRIVRQHPELGFSLMKERLAASSLNVILYHHERSDGTGYPDGRDMNNIPTEAKIACIADVYDALTTNRPYAEARKPFDALKLMLEQMGGHFDQEQLVAFIRILGGETAP